MVYILWYIQRFSKGYFTISLVYIYYIYIEKSDNIN